jgi:putative nucleotidyltransferase with HDIG domain
MQTVLLSDVGQEGVRLRRDLSLAVPCKLVAPDRFSADDIRAAKVIISNMSLDNADNVQALKTTLDQYRAVNTPVLFLLPDATHHAMCQANAIGATATLPANVSRERLLQTVMELLAATRTSDEPPTTAIARSSAMQAGISLAGIMDAVENGQPVSADALTQGTNHILNAIGHAEIRDWLHVVWDYDDATYQHCLLVAGLAAGFAHELGFGTVDCRRLVKASLLHDIGKAGIPLTILNKPDRLTGTEFEIMQRHPVVGHELLVAQGGFDPEQLSVVRHHHEYLDGSGYPDRLAGAEIIDLVRLTTICDIYAALIERRPYRAALAADVAFSMLEAMGGKLDTTLVRAFRKVTIACMN